VNPRELLQSAQAAEREGDLERAAALLEQAARLYEETGHPARAAQMRRHVERLGLPTSPLERPRDPDISSGGDERRSESSPLDSKVSDISSGDISSGGGRTLVERAPALAEPGLDAWCSFCCRPSREVGRLVAGPTQAFICSACTELAASLLFGRSSA
jgi:hypothetical protein